MKLVNTKNQVKIWPGYIPPLKDELFSSWFTRLCYEHRMKTYSFSKFYLNNLPIWNRDIDLICPKELSLNIEAHTPLNNSEIQSLFLDSYSSVVFESITNKTTTSGILSLGIYHRKRKKLGQLCCPSCLNQDIPYYRKQWRLKYSLGCQKCKCNLIDHCPICLNPITFYRLENGKKSSILNNPLYLCWKCKYDLRKASVFYRSDSDIYRYQKYIDSLISKGYDTNHNYSFTFFSVLDIIISKLLSSSRKWARVRNVTEKYYNISFPTRFKKQQHYNLSERKLATLITFKTLQNWPKNFIQIYGDTNVRYCDFSKDMNEIPFWFYKVIKFIQT